MTRGGDRERCERCRGELASGALFCPMCGSPRAQKEDDALVGHVVAERYRVRERLGQGASGSIYAAEHVTLKRKVALKILHHELSRDDLAIERFRREATTVGEIDNEHIVEVYDFGRLPDGRLFLAMELLDGETLKQIVRAQGKLPIAQVIDVLTQVGEALMEAHAMGYVHRDLRPGNVMLARRRGRAGFVKLLDFGLAKLVEREGEAASTSLGMTFGDPCYMSPEQARGDPVDRRADIYSLGVMAYELLTGRPPFVGKKVFDVLMQHIEQAPEPVSKLRPDCPPWLEAVVMRALAKRADDRFVTVYRFVEALREGQTSGTIMSDEAARSMPAGEVPQHPAPRRKETADDVPTPVPGTLPPVRPKPSQKQNQSAASASASNRMSMKAMRQDAASPKANPGMSAAWYADGDAIGEEGEGAADRPASGRAARDVGDDDGEGDDRPDESDAGDANDDRAGAGAADDDDRDNDRDDDDDDAHASAEPAPPSRPAARRGRSDPAFLDARADSTEPVRTRGRGARGAAGGGGGMFAEDSMDDSLFRQSRPRRGVKLAVGLAAAAALAFIVVAAWPRGDGGQHSAASAVDDAAQLATAPPDAGAVAAVPAHDAGAPTKVATASAPPAGAAKSAPGTHARRNKPDDDDAPPPRGAVVDFRPKADAGAASPPPSKVAAGDAAQADFYVKLGEKALREGDAVGAANHFNKAREFDNTNAEAIAGLGEVAMRQGYYEDATVHLSAASRLAPRSARIAKLYGQACLAAGKKEDAAEAFKKALKINPDDGEAIKGYKDATGG